MNNFKRDYHLIITVEDTEIVVRPDLRVSFTCVRSSGNMGNKLDITIYNLKEANRLLLIKDAELYKDQVENRNLNVIFDVGYEGNTNTIFKGQIHTAGSKRSGTDIITEIVCISSGQDVRYGHTSASVNNVQFIQRVLKDMPGTVLGKVSPTLPKLLRPIVIVGNSLNQLQKAYPDFSVTIDNGVLNIVADNEYIGSSVPVISPGTGLIGTPYRESQKVVINAIMIPQVYPLGLVNLQSSIREYLNGDLRVETVTFRGDNWSNEWGMEIVCFSLDAFSKLG